MGIPSPAPKPWYVREVWPAAVGLLLGVPASAFALIKECISLTRSGYQVAALAVAALSVAALGTLKLLQSMHKDAENDKKDSPRDLRGCLHVVHRIVAGHKSVEPGDAWLRITVHRVDGNELEQLVDYVGAIDANKDKGGSVGRRFSISTGIIGKVARSVGRNPLRVSRPRDMGFAEWQRYLIDETGMTAAQAADTRADRFDFLGVPIIGPDNDVRAVLYLDSAEVEFFDETTVAMVAAGCKGLATWIDEHYYRK